MVSQVLELSPDKFAEWLAYFKLKAKEAKRTEKRNAARRKR